MSSHKTTQYIVTIAAFSILGGFILKFSGDFYKIRDISFAHFAALFALALSVIAINGLKIKQIAGTAGVYLGFREWFGLASITSSLNSLLFKSGTVVSSNYLKRTYGLPYMSYIGAFGADFLIVLSISSWLGLTISSYLLFTGKGEYKFMAAVFFAVIVVIFLIMNNTFNFKKREHRIFDALDRAHSSLNNLLRNKKAFWTLCFLDIGLVLLSSLRFYVSARVLHFNIPLSHCFLFIIAVMAIGYLPMIQGDIGSRELAVGLLSEFLGNGMKEGFLVTVVDRLFVLFWCLVFAVIYKNILIEKKSPS